MNLRVKVLLLATLPLIAAIAAIAYLVNQSASELSQKEIAAFEQAMFKAKKAELLHYVSLALTSIDHIYNAGVPETPESDQAAKALVKRVLNRLTYGPDGYFFVYDYSGTNLVHPKQPWRVGNSYLELEDPKGRKVIRELIAQARRGGGYFRYTWEQPSTRQMSEKIGYAVALERWGWMLGTGIYIDDIAQQVRAAQAQTKTRVHETFLWILAIAVTAVLSVFATGVAINARESQLANARLRTLTNRIVVTQEEERARVSRELHDGISQILVSVKFALERAQLMMSKPASSGVGSASRPTAGAGDIVREDMARADANLKQAITEVRRISHDLRPGILDDLGLAEALHDLTTAFETRTDIQTALVLPKLAERLPIELETTFYRIAQEALTNIERHASATVATVRLDQGRNGLTLWVIDDGSGMIDPSATVGAQLQTQSDTSSENSGRTTTIPLAPTANGSGGIGLRNMEKRLEPFDGTLVVQSRAGETRIGARVPPRHFEASSGTRSQRAPVAGEQMAGEQMDSVD